MEDYKLPTRVTKKRDDVKNAIDFFTKKDWDFIKTCILDHKPFRLERSYRGMTNYSLIYRYIDDIDAYDYGKWILTEWIENRWPDNWCGSCSGMMGETYLNAGYKWLRDGLYSACCVPFAEETSEQLSIFDFI